MLAEDIVADFDNPPFARSPLDGYACRSKDTKGAGAENPVHLRTVETVYAGTCPQKEIVKDGGSPHHDRGSHAGGK